MELLTPNELQVLQALRDGLVTAREITEYTNIPRASIYRIFKKFYNGFVIEREGNGYALVPLGVELLKLQELFNLARQVEDNNIVVEVIYEEDSES